MTDTRSKLTEWAAFVDAACASGVSPETTRLYLDSNRLLTLSPLVTVVARTAAGVAFPAVLERVRGPVAELSAVPAWAPIVVPLGSIITVGSTLARPVGDE